MDQKKITSRQTHLMAVAIAAAIVVVTAAMIYGINIIQNQQKATAQTYLSGTNTNMYSNTALANNTTTNTNGTSVKVVEPSKSTNKEFWINTVHLDGMTNINAAVKCDTCPQNTPLHPAEQPPVNSTIPTGG